MMKSLKKIFLAILISSLSATALYAQENKTYILHTIEKGQSLYSISSMYDVDEDDIIRLNPGAADKIYAGQTLKIPQNNTIAEEEKFHTIQPGETLYRLTQIYNITAKEIIDENPGLSAENFKIGQVVRIPIKQEIIPEPDVVPEIPAAVVPRCQEMHKVKRKETIFSVSQKYGITEEELRGANPELKDGMKRGQYLCIPFPAPKIEAKRPEQLINPPSNNELFRQTQDHAFTIPVIKAAVILPFTLEGEGKSESSRMIEYYEGFLMAVDSLKKRGVSMEIYAYCSGNKQSSIQNILVQPELKDMNIIFGPLYQEHIKPLSDFSDQHNIRLVIPITMHANAVYQNPYIYQVNPPQSYLYSEVYEHFTRTFINANVIVLDMGSENNDKADFITGLKQELNNKKISVQTLNGEITKAKMQELLQSGKHNIFVPTSGNNAALVKIMPQLKLLVKEEPNYKISLFGYPEWQTYTKDHLESFFELDTYFYSFFYTNNLLPTSKNFINSYSNWYSKEMAPTYPKYGMLGFDTAYFFLSGLANYGTGLEANVSGMHIPTIQTGLKFERVNNWGGFINKKVFFIHLTREHELIKMDFD